MVKEIIKVPILHFAVAPTRHLMALPIQKKIMALPIQKKSY